ncbi:MAG TPA: mechanosensitive ion channel family protein [Ohtaekwangia sp.]|uniref:mechanosensitive ion channel family protein n=1 Tax=Ohtaekwangia sp. TaxID=2066019 RepID=UPI002F9267EA
MNELLKREYFHNTLLDYLIAASIIVLGTLLLRLFKRTLLKRLKLLADKTTNTSDNFIVQSIERFGVPALNYFIIYAGLNYLALSVKTEQVLRIVTAVVITFFVLRLLSSTILLLLQNYIKRQEHGEEKIKQLAGVMLLINIVVWLLGIVFLIDNLGYNVTTIITGLGIGGIAVALAAQNILGDLFNYFVIFFDRPFEVGDFIIVDDKMGTIEYIGLKTTRVRSLSGEQIVIGNSNLTGARIHNYKRLFTRRVVFTLNVDYRTPVEKLKSIPGIIRATIEGESLTKFDRSHFAAYGDWSLRYETVYFVEDPDYNKFMDIQQNINLKLYEALLKNEIYFVTGFHMQLAPPPPKPEEKEEEQKQENGQKK